MAHRTSANQQIFYNKMSEEDMKKAQINYDSS